MEQGRAVCADAGDDLHLQRAEELRDLFSRHDRGAIGLVDIRGDFGQGLGHGYSHGDGNPELLAHRGSEIVGDVAETLAPKGPEPVEPHETLVDGIDLDLRRVAPQDGEELVGHEPVVAEVGRQVLGLGQELPGLPHRHAGDDASALRVVGLGDDHGPVVGEHADGLPRQFRAPDTLTGSVEGVRVDVGDGVGPVGDEHGMKPMD
jgi:hypothetical protein